MNETDVRLDVTRAGIAVVTLNRPDKRNAFNADVIEALSDIFETLRTNEQVRVVFLRGAGKSFSAGADFKWMQAAQDWTHDDNVDDALGLAHMLGRLHDLPQMTVALVHGAAMGGGAGLVAACDVAVVVKDTKISFSEVRIGLTPATISPYVIKAIGPRWARALFVSGETFDGTFAGKIGLAQYTVESVDDLDDMMEHLAELAFQTAPGAVKDAKHLVDDVFGHELNEHLAHMTAKRIADRRVSDEGREGLSAILEKRKPGWTE